MKLNETIREAKVAAVKKSEARKNTYYVTVDDGLGEIKLVATRSYNIGDTVKVKRRNPVDWIWDIVKEK